MFPVYGCANNISKMQRFISAINPNKQLIGIQSSISLVTSLLQPFSHCMISTTPLYRMPSSSIEKKCVDASLGIRSRREHDCILLSMTVTVVLILTKIFQSCTTSIQLKQKRWQFLKLKSMQFCNIVLIKGFYLLSFLSCYFHNILHSNTFLRYLVVKAV